MLKRNVLTVFLGWLILMTVGVSAYGHQVKLTPQLMGSEIMRLMDGELKTELVLNDPFDQGYQEFVFDFGEKTELAAYKVFLTEPRDLAMGMSYDQGNGLWQEVAPMGITPLLNLREGWNRVELHGLEVQKVKITFYGTSHQSLIGVSELEFWGVNSQQPIELFSATQIKPVEIGKGSGTVQEYIYQIPVERNLISLQQTELVYQSYDLESSEGLYSVNQHGVSSLTAKNQHLRSQQVLNERLIAPFWIEQGINLVETSLGDTRKNGFRLENVGLKLHFDRGQLEVVDAAIYQNGRLIDQLYGDAEFTHPGGLRVANLLDGQTDTYWESASVTPTEAVIQLELGQKVWLEQINFDFDVLFQGELSLEYEQNGVWYPIQNWAHIAFNELENGWNNVTLGNQGIITDQIRVVLDNTVNQVVVGRLRDIQIWGSRSQSLSTAPEVVITYPEDQSFVGNQSILQGYVLHPFSSVTLNGQSLMIESGVFEMELDLAPERSGQKQTSNGSATLEVVAINQEAEVASDQITVYMDTPPEVEIISPVDRLDTKEPQVLVKGTVDTSGYELTLNGQPISYYGNSFSCTYDLVPGLNLITVTAKDHKGLLGTDQVRIYYDAEAPLLSFAEDYHLKIIGQESVTVRGNVYDYTPVELSMNGNPVPVAQGNFTAKLPLPEEFENEFEVTVVDQAGNATETNFTILRDLTPPEAFIPVAEPADWSQVTQPTVHFETIDALSGISHYQVRIDGGEYLTVTSPNQLPALSDGTHLIEVKAVDQIGWSTVGSVQVHVDTTPPEPFTPVAEPGDWNQETRPTITFGTRDADSGVDHFELKVDDGSYQSVTSPYQLAELADGEHTVTVRAIDRVGLVTEETVQVFVDTTPAGAPSTFKGVPGPAEVVLTWSPSVEDDVTHYLMSREPAWSDGAEYRKFEETLPEYEKYEYVDDDVVVGSSYRYQLIAVDHAENQSEPFTTESPAGIIQQEIDPAIGGTVEYADLTVEVPEGAMQERKLIEIKAKQVLDVPPMVNQPIGGVLSLNLVDPITDEVEEHVTFDQELTLTFTYDESELEKPEDELNIEIFYYDEIREFWVKVPREEQNILQNTITVKVNHFTDFAAQVTENYSPSAADYRDMGLSPFQSYFQNKNEYVSPASGGLTIKTTDLHIPGRGGMDLELGRIYSTALAKKDMAITPKKHVYLGYGWSLSIPYISFSDSDMYFHTEDGAAYQVEFDEEEPSNWFKNNQGGFYFLTKRSAENILIRLPSGIQYTFGYDRIIRRKEDMNGNYLQYDIVNNKINSIRDGLGRTVNFTYNGDYLDYYEYDGKIYDFNYTEERISDEKVFYRLSQYIDPAGRITKYDYTPYEFSKTGSSGVAFRAYLPIDKDDPNSEWEWTTLDQDEIFVESRSDRYLLSEIEYPSGGVSTYLYQVMGYSLTDNENKIRLENNLYYKYNIFEKPVVIAQKQYMSKADQQMDQNPIKEKTFEYALYDATPLINTTTMTTPQHTQTVFVYSEDDGLTEQKNVYDLTRQDQTTPLEKIVYIYTDDVENKLVKEEQVYREGVFRYKTVYDYDDWGNVIYKENTRNGSVVHSRYLNTNTSDVAWSGFLTPPEENSEVQQRYDLLSDSYMVNQSPVGGDIHTQTHYAYDSVGNLIRRYKYSSHDRKWYDEAYEHDGYGNVTKIVDAEGNETNLFYSEELQGAYLTSTSRVVTRPQLSFEDQVTTETITVHSGYDFATGDKIWELDGKGHLTTYNYDIIGRLMSIVYPDENDGTFEPTGHYAMPAVVSERENNPCKVQIYNDAEGYTTVTNLIQPVDLSDGATINQIVSSPLPEVASSANPTFNRTIYYYDSLNRLKDTHQYLRPSELLPGQANPIKTIFGYDRAGNQDTVVDAEGNMTIKTFDGLGRLKKIEYPELRAYSETAKPTVEIHYYDGTNKQETVDAKGRVTTVQKDWNGNITQVTRTIGGISYTEKKVYDQLNQVVKETDAKGNETKYYRDSFGWIRKTELPAEYLVTGNGLTQSGTTTVLVTPTILTDYDKLGRKVSEISPMGVAKYGVAASTYFEQDAEYVTNYTYDELGQLIETNVGGERKSWNFYDENGNVTKVVTSDGRIERNEYTPRGQLRANMVVDGLEEVVVQEDGSLEYTDTWAKSEEFDPALSLMTYYDYNIIGQAVEVTSPQGIEPVSTSEVADKVGLFGIEWQVNRDYTVETEYDALGRKRVERQTVHGTEPKVYENRYDYNLVGNVVREINPGGQVKEYFYNNLYWVDAEVVYKAPFTSHQEWESVDPQSMVDAESALVTRYIYDLVGNKRTMTDSEGKETRYFYDEFNRLKTVENILGEKVDYRYDIFGNKTSELDGGGKTKVFSYDKYSNLQTVTEANNAITTYYYDVSGNMTASVMDDKYTRSIWHNQYGEVIAEQRGEDPLITYQYDAGGNLTQVTDRKGQVIKIFYNRLGMPVRKEFYDADGALVETNSFLYDRNGNQTNGMNDISSVDLFFNPLGQVESETQKVKGNTYSFSYNYDDAGNMTDMMYPGATKPVSYEFNGYNRIENISGYTSDATPVQYSAMVEYTPSGFMEKLVYKRDEVNLTTTMITLDDLYRQRQILVTGQQSQNGYYRDVVVGSQLFNKSYEYDGAGNVTKWKNNLTGYENAYGYDDVHNLTSAKVEGTFVQERPGTKLVATGDFKAQKSMQAVSDDLYQVSFDYNANSIGMSFVAEVPIVKVEIKHFDDLVSVLSHRFSKKALSILTSADNVIFTEMDRNDWEFSLDVYGNIGLEFIQPVKVKYVKIHSRIEDRDGEYQIVDAAVFKNYLSDMVHVYQPSSEGSLGYAYDVVGNRTEKSRLLDSGSDKIKYHYDAGGLNGKGRRLLYETIVGTDGVERNLYGYRYDVNGNLVEKSSRFTVGSDGSVTLTTTGVGVELWQYEYDVQNRLVEVKRNGSVIASYGYDVNGQRIYSEVGGRSTRYLYGYMGAVLYEEDEGAENRKYIYLNGKKIIEVRGYTGESDEIYYYQQDHLGSTSLVTDQNGQVVANQDYLPFGDDLNRPGVLTSEGSDEVRYKYTGQYQQYEIGLYYYVARFYDPRVGRFITEDTYLGDVFEPRSLHLYLYVLNCPMKYVDPTGHMPAGYVNENAGGLDAETNNVVDAINAVIFTANGGINLSIDGRNELIEKYFGTDLLDEVLFTEEIVPNFIFDPRKLVNDGLTLENQLQSYFFAYHAAVEAAKDGNVTYFDRIGVYYVKGTLEAGLTSLNARNGSRMYTTDELKWAYLGAEGNQMLVGSVVFELLLINIAESGLFAKTTEGATEEATGQLHHLISNKIKRALDSHPRLKGRIDRENPFLKYRARNLDAHKGYQKWHRLYDQTVVQWLKDNPNVSYHQFIKYLHNLHQQSWLKERIPNVDLLDKF